MELKPGTEFAGYRILRELGRGGMAVVYEAEQTRLKRSVALKVLPEFHAASADAVMRFRREAEAGARLQHPNIVQVHERGSVGETQYIAMEYVRGGSLAKVISDTQARRETRAKSDGPPEIQERRRLEAITATTDRAYIEWAVRVAIDVLHGLQHAHTNGVVHRDIKPQNLLLDEDGRVLIADFGLARLIEDPAFSQVGQPHGTPWYMSPEQVAVGVIPVDHRSDVFSLGVTLYEMLTLERPFPGRDITTVFRQILHKEPSRLRMLNPRLPRDLETIVLMAMEKDPDRRYQTAQDFADDLQRFLNFEDILARPVGPLGRAWRRASRNRALTAVSVLLVLAVLVGGSYYVNQRLERGRQVESMLARAATFEEAGAYDRAESVLRELLRHVAPGHPEAEERLQEVARLRRAEADRLLRDAERLVLEQRYERARAVIEEARRMAPGDERVARLYEEAAGYFTVRVVVADGPARIYTSEYIQVRRAFAPTELRGETDGDGGLDLTLVTGDYLLTAVAADGRFSESWVPVDPLVRLRTLHLRLRPTDEVTAAMVRIPPGAYPVGQDDEGEFASVPRAQVPLEAFWMDRTEATKGEYERFLQHLRRTGGELPFVLPLSGWAPGKKFKPEAAGMPMEALTWLEATRFLAFLGKRLPLEAEWEAAARGPEGRLYPWGDAWDATKANVDTRKLEPAGSRGGEGYLFGLYDVIGNAGEWTADRFLPYPGNPNVEPMARARAGLWKSGKPGWFDVNQRVVRGGLFDGPPRIATGTFRLPNFVSSYQGVRGVRSARPRMVSDG